jgi:hypothetical protein
MMPPGSRVRRPMSVNRWSIHRGRLIGIPRPLGMSVRPQTSLDITRKYLTKRHPSLPSNSTPRLRGGGIDLIHSYPGTSPEAANLMPSGMIYRSCADNWRKRCRWGRAPGVLAPRNDQRLFRPPRWIVWERTPTPRWTLDPGTPFRGDPIGGSRRSSWTSRTCPTPLVAFIKATSRGVAPPKRGRPSPVSDVDRPPGTGRPRPHVTPTERVGTLAMAIVNRRAPRYLSPQGRVGRRWRKRGLFQLQRFAPTVLTPVISGMPLTQVPRWIMPAGRWKGIKRGTGDRPLLGIEEPTTPLPPGPTTRTSVLVVTTPHKVRALGPDRDPKQPSRGSEKLSQGKGPMVPRARERIAPLLVIGMLDAIRTHPSWTPPDLGIAVGRTGRMSTDVPPGPRHYPRLQIPAGLQGPLMNHRVTDIPARATDFPRRMGMRMGRFLTNLGLYIDLPVPPAVGHVLVARIVGIPPDIGRTTTNLTPRVVRWVDQLVLADTIDRGREMPTPSVEGTGTDRLAQA